MFIPFPYISTQNSTHNLQHNSCSCLQCTKPKISCPSTQGPQGNPG